MVEPDCAFGASHFIAQIHAAAEGPAHLELADGAALELDQGNAVVFGLDRVDQRILPAHHFHGPVVLADKVADDLDAMAAQVNNCPAASLLNIPEPGAVRTGMGFA